VNTQLEALVTSMLFEGYALYPYTPEAAKNATPTPFGIVYPRSYAAQAANTHDHLQVDVAIEAPPDAALSAQVRFLEPGGERHQAVPRRVELDGPGTEEFSFGRLSGRLTLERAGSRVRLRVENLTPFDRPGADRPTALRSSLLSTHAVIETGAGRFLSPLDEAGDNVNCWPVLATASDDAILAAAIMLPDHPQLAPNSKGDLFDGTEIEEALLLHVHALSEGERESIDEQDPAVRAMIARAAATTPEDIFRLHAVMTPTPGSDEPANQPGEAEVEVDGRVFRRGGKVVLRPRGSDLHDTILDGRLATVERIYVDMDDRVHLGVTVDDDPGRDVMRTSGRYTFFKPDEVELR
jgi:hypothetical protein